MNDNKMFLFFSKLGEFIMGMAFIVIVSLLSTSHIAFSQAKWVSSVGRTALKDGMFFRSLVADEISPVAQVLSMRRSLLSAGYEVSHAENLDAIKSIYRELFEKRSEEAERLVEIYHGETELKKFKKVLSRYEDDNFNEDFWKEYYMKIKDLPLESDLIMELVHKTAPVHVDSIDPKMTGSIKELIYGPRGKELIYGPRGK